MASSDIEEYVPCYNFAMVCPGIYRSAHPTRKNFRFLRALQLKSVCYLCPEAYPADNVQFCEDFGIQIFHFNLEENREPFSEVRRDIVDAVMRVVMDTRNHPILIHCERGRHRTGVVCGCVRRLQGWSLGSIYSDYALHNSGKGRLSDQQFLDLYEPIVKVQLPYVPSWLLEDFTLGATGGASSSPLLMHVQYPPEGGPRSECAGPPPIACNPQVTWSTTSRLVGSGASSPVALSACTGSADGLPSHERGLPCISSHRTNVTLILCPDDKERSPLMQDTQPMVLAVTPQCSYVLSELMADKGRCHEGKGAKDKKEKKSKGMKEKSVALET